MVSTSLAKAPPHIYINRSEHRLQHIIAILASLLARVFGIDCPHLNFPLLFQSLDSRLLFIVNSVECIFCGRPLIS